jgi:putative transposase
MERILFPQLVVLGIHRKHVVLKLNHHIHSSFEKSIIERTMQYIEDRTENFDDYFPCKKKNKCKLNHVKQWLNLFIDQHNKEITS